MTVGDVVRAIAREGERQLAGSSSGLDRPCTGVTHDSRRVEQGAVFVALRGLKADGAAFEMLDICKVILVLRCGRPCRLRKHEEH